MSRGTVYGQGTSKSDSVLVRLSRGEEVIQEPYASLNRDLLKAINRGDFHQGMLQPKVIIVNPAQQAPQKAGTTINYTSVNPVVRDDFQDAWDRSQESGFDL